MVAGAQKAFFFVLLFISSIAAVAADVTARVDRSEVREGETLRFILQSNGDGEPDFAPLEREFDLLGTTKSSQVSFINGRMDSRTEWIVTLAPKRTGTLTIPPVSVGKQRSKRLHVKVRPADQVTASGVGRDLFIEAEITPKTAYVQGQVVYTVRVFQGVELREAGLSEPKIADAVVERLGEDVTYTTTRDNRSYRVTERRYAIFPQSSGKLVIPPTTFGAQIIEGRPSMQLGPDPFSRFFQQPTFRPVRRQTKPFEIEVRPKPPEAGDDWWLPADSVVLTESWAPNPPVFRVGESITRVVSLEAVGLTGAQLPEIISGEIQGAKVYPDRPQVETRNDGTSLQGVRQERLALVPTAPGELVLPEIRIPWWDTRLEKRRVAVLPAKTVTVLAASAKGAPITPEAEPDPAHIDAGNPAPMDQAPGSAPLPASWYAYLPWTTLFFFTAWIVTLFAWWTRRRPREPQPSKAPAPTRVGIDSREVREALQRAGLDRSPAETRDALLQWAALRWPDDPPPSIGAVGERLGSDALMNEIDKINRVLYGSAPADWDGEAFWEAFDQARRSHNGKGRGEQAVLPELFPKNI